MSAIASGCARAVGALALVGLLYVGHGPARAEPEIVAAPDNGPTFSLLDMGAVAPLAFYGDQGNSELTFPVPRGLVPLALNATIEMPVNVRSGVISVVQKERTIARIPLPLVDQAPLVIPLAGVVVEDNAVTVTLRSYLLPVEGYCLDPTNPLRLTNATVSFGGTEVGPSTVAEFLPPILRKLTIAIPQQPSIAESDAAVRLATAVTAHYGQQPVAVVLTTLEPGPPPAAAFERTIAIRQDPIAGVSLQPVPDALPTLRISGTDGDLTNQARLLSSDLSRLALSSKAVVGPIKTTPQLPGAVTTLRALGQPVVAAVALSPQVALGLDQTRLGRPVKGLRVHLIGSYTPPPASVSGRLSAIVGGETIDSWSVDGTGVIDRWVDVPDRLLQRYTTLGISLNIAGNTGRCGEFQPLTLTIDGDSVVESTAAAPPVPAGLQSLPQGLMPRALVGIGPDAFADTVRAAAIAVAMQRLSVLPFDTEVTSVGDALAGKLPAIIVSADGWEHPEVTLPVSADRGTLTLDGVIAGGEATTLTLDPELKFGTLQAFFDRGRSLLVATSNGAPAQLDQLLRWMSADLKRWSRQDGTAVVLAPGQNPVVVGAQPAPAGPGPDSNQPLGWWMAAASVVVAGAAAWFLRSRRRRGAHGDR